MNSDKNKHIKSIPPFECVVNGCKERSEKCNNCRWCNCIWFYTPADTGKLEN